MTNNVKLFLKKRAAERELLSVPRKMVQDALESPDPKQSLLNIFGGVPRLDNAVHDKAQLEVLAYWVPQGGLAAREDAQWLGLRSRIANLDDTVERVFTLTPGQADLIWRRLTNAEFKITRPNSQWSAFVEDYLLATGHAFSEVTADLFEDPDAESAAAAA